MTASARHLTWGLGLTAARVTSQGALAAVCQDQPKVKAEIAKSAGHGSFTRVGMSFFVGGAGGSGPVPSYARKTDTFMAVGRASTA